jgi:hypothetical protein
MISRTKSFVLRRMERGAVGNALLLSRGYLRDSGWLASAASGSPVDAAGDPRPWICLPAIRFLEERVPSDARVFEWGSGSSTRWWAARTASVRSCEHDLDWLQRTASTLPPHASVVHRPLDGDDGDRYVDEIEQGGPWDIVMIDGRRRIECGLAAVPCLSDRGVIVWDDTARVSYEEGLQAIMQQGYSRVDFHGLKPCSRLEHSTSILYRSGENLLGL